MKICVLQPDYSTTDVDYKNYDPPRDLSHLLHDHEVHHEFLNKLTTYKQLQQLSYQNFDIYVNLCEAYLEWEVPGIDVIYSLEILNLPFTGPTTILYDPPKPLMKYVAYCSNVKTPEYAIITSNINIYEECKHLKYPLFVKPAKAGDSLGIDEKSMIENEAALVFKVTNLLAEFKEVLVEEYVDGREFTVLVVASTDGKSCLAYNPVEYIFSGKNKFKTYSLKTSELHTDANVPVTDELLNKKLKEAASAIFKNFNGAGYARLDFRTNAQGELFFLEINFTASVFYSNGYEGSADYILKYDIDGQAGFIKKIMDEGIARYKRKQKCYIIKGNATAGFGIYATRNIEKEEVVFAGEGKAQRIATRNFVHKNWNEADKKFFDAYAYPIGNEAFILWDENPAEWAPQNHSCNANTVFNGLIVITLRSITIGEELTLDYAEFLHKEAAEFTCKCGSANCRGIIKGSL